MQPDQQNDRRIQIEKAAFEVLAEKGFRRTSMLQIAKRAKASNETLYAWYGNKQALFSSIIEENGKAARSLLNHAERSKYPPLETLQALGPLLLQFVATENAITINRATVEDASETGMLAQAIDKLARDSIYPLLCRLMDELAERGDFVLDAGPRDAADSYLALLFGEVQIRQAFGIQPPFSQEQITAKADRAFDLMLRLFGAAESGGEKAQASPQTNILDET